MAIRDRNKARNGTRARQAVQPDLSAILSKFNDAWSFLNCGIFFVENQDDEDMKRGPGDGILCLHHGLELLAAAYKELDLAIPLLEG